MYNVINMKNIAKQLNNRTYTDYYYRLKLLAKSVFKWENLPNGINEKWIEQYLFSEGSCLFFKDSEKGFMVTKYTPAGTLNYYDEPTKLHPTATNFSRSELTLNNYTEAVIICNNDDMIPTAPTIELHALRLAELSRTIDININAQKTPVLILSSDKQRLSLKNVFAQWNGYEPVIYGDKDLNIEGIKVLKMDAPVVFDKLQYQKHSEWNEAMTFLGINNANQDKRERLVDDEVQANNEQVESSAHLMLKARQDACDRINEVFQLDKPVKVSLRKLAYKSLQDIEEEIEDAQNRSESILKLKA